MPSASWGLSLLNSSTKASNLACCCRKLAPAGRVACCFRVRCMRSWRPFCCGMARANALDRNAEAQPPDRKPGELKKAVRRSEGNAVIGADRLRQAAFPEQALEGRKRQIFAGGFQRFAQQQKARGLIGDGERITVAFIARAETRLCNRRTTDRWDSDRPITGCPRPACAGEQPG